MLVRSVQGDELRIRLQHLPRRCREGSLLRKVAAIAKRLQHVAEMRKTLQEILVELPQKRVGRVEEHQVQVAAVDGDGGGEVLQHLRLHADVAAELDRKSTRLNSSH